MRGARWLTSLSALGALLLVGAARRRRKHAPSRPRPCLRLYDVFSSARSIRRERDLHLQQPNQSRGQHHDMDEQGERTTNNPRQMTGAIDRLNYYLCQDANCTKLWGDKSYPSDSGPITIPAGTVNLSVSLPIYGMIPAGQDVSAGIYTDTVLVEVDF